MDLFFIQVIGFLLWSPATLLKSVAADYEAHPEPRVTIQLIAGPGNVTVAAGSTVSFCCVWTGSYDLPLWIINGKIFSSLYLPDNYNYDNKEGLQLLSAEPENDGNTYSCGFYHEQSLFIQSPPGTLHVYAHADNSQGTVTSCQQFQPPIQPTPPPSAFKFITEPVDTVAMEGNSILCECQAEGTYDLPLWYINGNMFSSMYLPRGYTSDPLGLKFPAVPSLNGTVYQCSFLQIVSGKPIEHMSTRGSVTIISKSSIPPKTCDTEVYSISFSMKEQNYDQQINISWSQTVHDVTSGCIEADPIKCPSATNYYAQIATCSNESEIVPFDIADLSSKTSIIISKNDLEQNPTLFSVSLRDSLNDAKLIRLSTTNITTNITIHDGKELYVEDLNQQFEFNHLVVCISTPSIKKCCPFKFMSEFVEGLNFTYYKEEPALYAEHALSKWNGWQFTIFAAAGIDTNCNIVPSANATTTVQQLIYSFRLSHGYRSAEVCGTLVFLISLIVLSI